MESRFDSGAKNSSQTLEATYVTAVFDVLGKVCAVEARITAAHRDNENDDECTNVGQRIRISSALRQEQDSYS
jgi:hypothetical protein